MDDAASLPEFYFAACLLHHVPAQVLIGREKDGLPGRNLANDFLGVAGSADDVAQRFHFRAAIDVA